MKDHHNWFAAPDAPLLTTRLIQRALYLEHPFLAKVGETVAESQMRALAPGIVRATDVLRSIAAELRAGAQGSLTIEGFYSVFESAANGLGEPSWALIDALRQVRAALASGMLPAAEREVERDLTRALDLLARGDVAADGLIRGHFVHPAAH